MKSSRNICFSICVLLALFSPGWCQCHFNGYMASCVLNILEEHIEATAIINNCHLPIDITFIIAYQNGNSTRHTWPYTFVTTNQNERVLIPGLLLPVAPHAPVFLYARVPERYFNMHNSSFVSIEASLVAEIKKDEWEEAEFLNHTTYISQSDNCRFKKDSSASDPIPWIIGGLFGLTLFFGAIGGGCLWWRKRKMTADQLALVQAMEVGLPGAQPYQLGAAVEKENGGKHNGSDSPDASTGEKQNSENTESSENNFASQEVKSGGKGFKFGRLKEDHPVNFKNGSAKGANIDDSVVIGNTSFAAETLPRKKNKGHKKDESQVTESTERKENKENLEQNKVLPEGITNDAFLDTSREGENTNNIEPVRDRHLLSHPLEDYEDDGNSSQGARPKIRSNGLATHTGSAVSAQATSTTADSHKGL